MQTDWLHYQPLQAEHCPDVFCPSKIEAHKGTSCRLPAIAAGRRIALVTRSRSDNHDRAEPWNGFSRLSRCSPSWYLFFGGLATAIRSKLPKRKRVSVCPKRRHIMLIPANIEQASGPKATDKITVLQAFEAMRI